MKNLTKEEFYSALQSNEYGRQYLELIEKVKSENREWFRGSNTERHHIHPRKLGGATQDTSNIVICSIFEHIQAHYFLALVFSDRYSPMLYAFNMLVSRKFNTLSDLEQITLQDLENWSKVREAAAHRPHTEEEKQKISLGQVNRRTHVWTEEERKRASEQRKGKPAWNKGLHLKDLGKEYHFSEEGLQKSRAASAKRRGKIWVHNAEERILISPKDLQVYLELGYVRGTPGTCQKGSVHIHRGSERKMVSIQKLEHYLREGWQRGRGTPAPNRGKHHSEETKMKISRKNTGRVFSEERRKQCSERNRNKVHIHLGKKRKFVRQTELDSFLAAGWVRGRIFNRDIQEDL